MAKGKSGKASKAAPKIPTILEHYTSIVDDEIAQFNGIPDWFIDKNLSDSEKYVFETSGYYLHSETQKANLYKTYPNKYGTVSLWVPKSIVGTVPASERQSSINFAIGGAYNTYLKGLAQQNGVKLGSTKKTVKVLQKLEDAGITPPTKDEFMNMPYQG